MTDYTGFFKMDAPMNSDLKLMMENVKNSEFVTFFRGYFNRLMPAVSGNNTTSFKPEFRFTDSTAVASKGFSREDLFARLLSTALGLTASFAFSYFAIKWLVNVMDPTYKQKKEAQDRVSMD